MNVIWIKTHFLIHINKLKFILFFVFPAQLLFFALCPFHLQFNELKGLSGMLSCDWSNYTDFYDVRQEDAGRI